MNKVILQETKKACNTT